MADFGGDGIRLRGPAGRRLEEQQKKDLEDFLKEINDPLLIEKLTKDREKKAKGGIARGCGKVMSNRKKTTKYY